jgi:putative NADH-flavin reductase
MSKVLILGGTGGTGKHLVLQALAAGHDVTVLVRDPARLPAGSDRVHVATGDATDAAAVGAVVRGQDVVVSTLGVGNSLKSNGLITKAAPAVVDAMTQAGVRRLVWTSAYGVAETYRDVPLIPRIMIAVLLRDLYADKTAGEAAIQSSRLDWTLVHPSTLGNRPPTGGCRVGERLTMRGLPTIARADVADFLVKQIEDPSFLRKHVLISH